MLQVELYIQGTFDLVKNLPEEFKELPGDVSTLCSSHISVHPLCSVLIVTCHYQASHTRGPHTSEQCCQKMCRGGMRWSAPR